MPAVKKVNPNIAAPPPTDVRTQPAVKREPPNWTKLFNSFSVGFMGAIIGSLLTLLIGNSLMSKAAQTDALRHEKTLEFRNKLVAIEGINRVGGTVSRNFLTGKGGDEAKYQDVSLYGVKRKSDLRVGVSYASLLPGVESLDLEDSVADNALLDSVSKTFRSLYGLNIASTQVTKLDALKDLHLSKLNIDGCPIEYYQLKALGELKGITHLTLGIPQFEADGKTPYKYSPEIRDRLLEDLVSLESLQNLIVYDFNLNTETRSKLREKGVEIVETRH